MTRPRSQLVSVEATPYYHCISRCVRRSFLCGKDRYTGKNFEHRKPWLVERLALLANVFAIDVAAYSIMSDHYHLVLHLDPQRAASWSTEEVCRRWTQIFKGSRLVQKFVADTSLQATETALLEKEADMIREKLCSISKFMSCLNQYIARRANREDDVTGHFWGGRFISKGLLDEAGLITCMAYVDLNPVRAGIADSLETSDFTSVQNRLIQIDRIRKKRKMFSAKSLPRLMPFAESGKNGMTASIPFMLRDYLEIVDWTGRVERPDKAAYLPENSPRILARLGLSEVHWRLLSLEIQKESRTMLNGLKSVEKLQNTSSRGLVA